MHISIVNFNIDYPRVTSVVKKALTFENFKGVLYRKMIILKSHE